MAVIYVVEDDTNIQEIESIALKNSGHKVYTFDNAAQFYKKIKEKVPDLAILDVMLPDEDGYEIVKKIRQNPITRKVPVIMVTAKTSEIDMIRGLDIGADDYIRKPFSIIEFITLNLILINIVKKGKHDNHRNKNGQNRYTDQL